MYLNLNDVRVFDGNTKASAISCVMKTPLFAMQDNVIRHSGSINRRKHAQTTLLIETRFQIYLVGKVRQEDENACMDYYKYTKFCFISEAYIEIISVTIYFFAPENQYSHDVISGLRKQLYPNCHQQYAINNKKAAKK